MKPRVADLAIYSPCDEKNRDERLEKIAIKWPATYGTAAARPRTIEYILQQNCNIKQIVRYSYSEAIFFNTEVNKVCNVISNFKQLFGWMLCILAYQVPMPRSANVATGKCTTFKSLIGKSPTGKVTGRINTILASSKRTFSVPHGFFSIPLTGVEC